MSNTKTCNNCGEERSLDEFYKQPAGKHGVMGECRICFNERGRAYYKANKEKTLERQRAYYKTNIEKERTRSQAYYKVNKEKIAEKSAAYMRKRRAEDPEFRMLSNLRTRLYQVINGADKVDTTRNFLGCTTEELREHLESQFTDGMSWDNYGKHGWHIDHIVPCASFDMLDPEQQRECFHFTNLQPLWAKDNIKKSDKPPHKL